MKTFLKMMAVAAILIPLMTGCSDNKSGNGNDSDTEQAASADETVEVTEANFDVEGLNALTDKKELDSDDIDFIIDQTEILVRKVKGMDRKEYNAFIKKLDKRESEALIILAFGLEAAGKSDKMSGRQKARLEKLNEQLPVK